MTFAPPLSGPEQAAIRDAFHTILRAIGDDPSREGLEATPHRLAELYGDLFSGLRQDPVAVLRDGFDEGHQEMVILQGCPFYSMCEHHFLPFYGTADVAYIPHGRIVGIGRLARVVEILSRRPQVQERLTSQIADTIEEGLQPSGVAVVLRGQHLCMAMREGRSAGSAIITSANRGYFRRSAKTRAEFLALINNGR